MWLRGGLAAAAAVCWLSAGAVAQDRRLGDDEITCAFTSVPYLSFGTYDPFQNADLRSQGQFSYRCTEGNRQSARPVSRLRALPRARPKVRISLSQGLSNTYDRSMGGTSSDRLFYNIYLNAACTEIWGDGVLGTEVFSKTISIDRTENVQFFGKIPAGQSIVAGPYLDVLVVTIDF